MTINLNYYSAYKQIVHNGSQFYAVTTLFFPNKRKKLIIQNKLGIAA
jgi:hypothetical protein